MKSKNNSKNPVENLSGEKLGNYELKEVIGKGALSTVYKAVHKNLPNTPVAIKVFNNKAKLEKFQQEASALDGLIHEHIISVNDLSFEGEHPYIVLEYAQQSLRNRLDKICKKGMISLTDAVDCTIALGEALEYAHESGIIHRDIKPENILFVNGKVKLSDFNSAAISLDPSLEETLKNIEDDSLRESLYTKLTRHSAALGGTPAYMSPEQMDGKEPSAKSDGYSLGVVLYEMLTNSLPRGSFRKVTHSNPDAPVWLDDVIDRTLKANPKERISVSGLVSTLKKGRAGEFDKEAEKQKSLDKTKENIQSSKEIFVNNLKHYSWQTFKWATVPIWGPFWFLGEAPDGPPLTMGILMLYAVGAIIPFMGYKISSDKIENYLNRQTTQIAYVDANDENSINFVDSKDLADGEFEIKTFKDPTGLEVSDLHWISKTELVYLANNESDIERIYKFDYQSAELNCILSSNNPDYLGGSISDLGFNVESNKILFKSGSEVYQMDIDGKNIERMKIVSNKLDFTQHYSPDKSLQLTNDGEIEIEHYGGSFASSDIAEGFHPAWNPFAPPVTEAAGSSTAPVSSARTVYNLEQGVAPVASGDIAGNVAEVNSNTYVGKIMDPSSKP